MQTTGSRAPTTRSSDGTPPEHELVPYGVAAAILALLAVACCLPLLREGWFHSHEQIRPIARALAAWYEVADGDLYPRWLASGYLGKGVPLFNFYPPAFSLAVAYLHALGLPLLAGAKLVIYVLFLVGAWGVFAWARPHLGSVGALVAAILYLFAPYHFVDLYVRGATAEFTSLAVLPWLFRAIDLVEERLSARGLAVLALSAAGIMVSHFLGALMIAPFAAAYSVVRVVQTRRGWRALGRILTGGVVGAAVGAFFWLPALVEKAALSEAREARVTAGYYSAFLHFVEPAQWVDTFWGYGGSNPPGGPDEMSFQVGLVLLGAVALSVALAFRLPGASRRYVLLALGLGAAALWLTSSASSLWYSTLKPYQLVQFPWRFLGPVTLFLAPVGGSFVAALPPRRRWLTWALVSAVVTLSVGLSTQQRAVSRDIPLADDRATIEQMVKADGWSAKFGNEDEYLPRWASVQAGAVMKGGLVPAGPGVQLGEVSAGRKKVSFVASAPTQAEVVVPVLFFPGWKASLDGEEWPVAPTQEGTVSLVVPQGTHAVRLWFGTTPARTAGWLLTLAGLSAIAGVLALERVRARQGAAAPAGGGPWT